MRLLDRVRHSCRAVSTNSRWVHIEPNGLTRLAQRLHQQPLHAPPPDERHHLLNQGSDTLAFFLMLDAVNFGSGYFPHLHKPEGASGYYTIAGALTQWCRDHGVPTAEQLQHLTEQECALIFHQPADGGLREELMHLFCRSLNQLGLLISQDYQGEWSRFVADAEGSAENLVEQLFTLPSYQDVSQWHGQSVYFLKRAQITAADLFLAFNGQGYGRFSDMDRLTLFADNLVPHVLRCAGALVYDDDLLNRIERGEEIEAGSTCEVELRACAVTAVETLVALLRQQGAQVNAMTVDGLLWHHGQKPAIKAHRRHRTRTFYY